MAEADPAASEAMGASSRKADIAEALLRATDVTTDAWAVLEAVRDEAGSPVDVRVHYGNAAYWALTGLDPMRSLGRGFAQLVPGIDLGSGIATRLLDTLASRASYADRLVRSRPQIGPHAGQERVYEVEFTVSGDLLAAGFRDVTDDVAAAERQKSEARRSEALARFLAAAVDPAIDRPELIGTLAVELAATIGNLCVITEQTPDDSISLAGLAGGPGDAAAEALASAVGREIPVDPVARDVFFAAGSVLFATIEPDAHGTMVDAMRTIGFPDGLAASATSYIGVPIRSGGAQIGRIHSLRFADDAPYTGEDLATVEAIASAASLVLERRGVEDELARSLARFEALFEQAPVPMVAVGHDRVTRYNQAALELFGRDGEEMRRLSFTPAAPWIPADQSETWAAMRRQVAAGDSVRGSRFALVRPSGERREIEGASIPILTRDGSPAGVITVLTDLTDRLSLEAQFRHAQKMEALGRLAGGIAHDFNNVLMAILGYGQLLLQDLRSGRIVTEDAEQLVSATRRAIELTARLTTFARREATRTEPVEVAELIRTVMPLIERLAPESIDIVTHLQPTPIVILDRSEFEQVLVNLVVNAVDAMPAGGRLTIEVGAVDLDPGHASMHLGELAGPHVLVAVSDNGTGMDDATRARIFEPFYTTKGVGEGTGLGLAMVFASVERAGGTIWVYSEVGRGTTFKIYLPLADPAAQIAGGTRPVPVAAGGSESILLLEDDPLVRDLVGKVLRGLGYDVTVAARPTEALALAVDRRFDLMVSDIVMPEMTGDAVAARLRATQPDLRVIFMSGYTARALEFPLGPRDSLVQKPMAPRDLARIVRDALDHDSD